ncbi:MAG TPA: hypothetical protein VH796_03395 [Nitrososphaeraceae archaeon]|jgi:hypothetical protein
MINSKDRPSENNSSDRAHYLNENAELKKALIESGDEYSYQYRQHEDEISSMVEDLPSYMRWMNAKARLEELSAKYRPRRQSVDSAKS